MELAAAATHPLLLKAASSKVVAPLLAQQQHLLEPNRNGSPLGDRRMARPRRARSSNSTAGQADGPPTRPRRSTRAKSDAISAIIARQLHSDTDSDSDLSDLVEEDGGSPGLDRTPVTISLQSPGIHVAAPVVKRGPGRPRKERRSSPLDLTRIRTSAPAKVPARTTPRLWNLPHCPVFQPTREEFADPLAYIDKVAKETKASQAGMCKIIPPEGWRPPFALDTEVFSAHRCVHVA